MSTDSVGNKGDMSGSTIEPRKDLSVPVPESQRPPPSTTTRLRDSTDPADTSSSSSRHFHLLPPPTSTQATTSRSRLSSLQDLPSPWYRPLSGPLNPVPHSSVPSCICCGSWMQGRTQIGGRMFP
jgi:hypothetical protein